MEGCHPRQREYKPVRLSVLCWSGQSTYADQGQNVGWHINLHAQQRTDNYQKSANLMLLQQAYRSVNVVDGLWIHNNPEDARLSESFRFISLSHLIYSFLYYRSARSLSELDAPYLRWYLWRALRVRHQTSSALTTHNALWHQWGLLSHTPQRDREQPGADAAGIIQGQRERVRESRNLWKLPVFFLFFFLRSLTLDFF